MLPLYILLTCLSSYAWGRPSDPSQFCFGGCELALGIFRFNDTSSTPAGPPTLRAKNGCDNEFRVPSLYLCLRIYCTIDERVRGLHGMNETCQRRSNVTIPPFSIVDGYSDDDVDALRHLQQEEIPIGRDFVLNEVAVPSDEVFKLSFDTLDAVYFETRIHNIYGCAMYYFWAIIVAIGLSSHLIPYLLTFQSHNSKWQSLPSDDIDGTEDQSYKKQRSILETPYTWLKRYITIPATFGYKRSQNIGWCTIPTRVQSLVIGAFILINIILCSCSYRVFPNNIYWPRVYDQGLRYFADRTGIISTANLPLIWLFGIRNNAMMWLTGWDFATYNNFHRWVARVSTFEAVLHSLAYTVMIVAGEGSISEAWAYYLTYYQQKYFVNGVLATIFMVGILVASVYPLRRNFYEIFLWLHIILSILVIITMYYHVEIFRGYTLYIYPCVFIWLLDRLLRMFRVLSFNRLFWTTTASITYSPTSNIVRLSVPYTTSYIKPRPGTFYYLYVLDSWKLWENHPFTLGYATPEQARSQAQVQVHSPSSSMSLGTISPPRRATSPNIAHTLNSIPSTSLSPAYPPESAHLLPQSSSPSPPPSSSSPHSTPGTLTFLIRPYSGFTSRLRTSCLTSPSLNPSAPPSPNPPQANLPTTTHRILLEGPYGETQPFHTYKNILFIVGGTGIAVPLSYLRILTSDSDDVGTNGRGIRIRSRRGVGKREVKTRNVRIVWAVRERAFLDEVVERDLVAASASASPSPSPCSTGDGTGEGDGSDEERRKVDVKLKAYITQHSNPNPDVEEEDDKDDGDDGNEIVPRGKTKNAVEIRSGRPDIFQEVSNAVNDSAGSDLAVIACGPGPMADDARRAVVRMLAKGVSGIEYFEESFNW